MRTSTLLKVKEYLMGKFSLRNYPHLSEWVIIFERGLTPFYMFWPSRQRHTGFAFQALLPPSLLFSSLPSLISCQQLLAYTFRPEQCRTAAVDPSTPMATAIILLAVPCMPTITSAIIATNVSAGRKTVMNMKSRNTGTTVKTAILCSDFEGTSIVMSSKSTQLNATSAINDSVYSRHSTNT